MAFWKVRRAICSAMLTWRMRTWRSRSPTSTSTTTYPRTKRTTRIWARRPRHSLSAMKSIQPTRFLFLSEIAFKCFQLLSIHQQNEKNRLGQVKTSIEYLQNYLKEVADQDTDRQYSSACSCLANIYNSLVNYSRHTLNTLNGFNNARKIYSVFIAFRFCIKIKG